MMATGASGQQAETTSTVKRQKHRRWHFNTFSLDTGRTEGTRKVLSQVRQEEPFALKEKKKMSWFKDS